MRFNSLKLSMRNYDEGHVSEAITLSTHIATFVYDHGKKNQSLLTLIGNKEKVQFKDTAGPLIGNNLMPDALLCMASFGANGGKYSPMLHEGPFIYPDLRFKEWWNNSVFRSPSENKEMSRRDFVLGMRNLAGGSHVSPNWNLNFASLERDNPGGLIFMNNGNYRVPEHGPEYASVRQIGYELDVTLRKNFSDIIS